MINCDLENFGCGGGYFIPAIDFLATEGTCSNKCKPYWNTKNLCTFSCDQSNDKYEKYYCKPGTFKMHTSIEETQHEIYNNGPVMVGLVVYEDLYNYRSGVYEYTAGGYIGGHAIRAFGWGHDEDGFLYWILQN